MFAHFLIIHKMVTINLWHFLKAWSREKPLPNVRNVRHVGDDSESNRTAPFIVSGQSWLSPRTVCIFVLFNFRLPHRGIPAATHGGISRLVEHNVCLRMRVKCLCRRWPERTNHSLLHMNVYGLFYHSGASKTHVPLATACGTANRKEFHHMQTLISLVLAERAADADWKSIGWRMRRKCGNIPLELAGCAALNAAWKAQCGRNVNKQHTAVHLFGGAEPLCGRETNVSCCNV